MPVTNKAEAEALSIDELKKELESRGLPTEGLKQAVMLETLLSHLDKAATNGTAEEKPSEEPKAAAESTSEKSEKDAEKADDGEKAAPSTEPATAPASDASVTKPAEGEAAPTRTADEVSGGTEQPDAKKAKADSVEEGDKTTKDVEKAAEPATEAPSSEPAATTAE